MTKKKRFYIFGAISTVLIMTVIVSISFVPTLCTGIMLLLAVIFGVLMLMNSNIPGHPDF